MKERTCPRHGYGLAGDGCPICEKELKLKEREVEALEFQAQATRDLATETFNKRWQGK